MAEIRPVGRLEENIALAIVQADEDVGVARNDILHDLQPSRWRVVSVVEDRLQGGAELSEIVNVALFKWAFTEWIMIQVKAKKAMMVARLIKKVSRVARERGA